MSNLDQRRPKHAFVKPIAGLHFLDDRRTLGPHEEGAKVALPIWMDFMGEASKDQRTEDFPYSPLLTSPEQVKQILASAGNERLIARGSTDSPH